MTTTSMSTPLAAIKGMMGTGIMGPEMMDISGMKGHHGYSTRLHILLFELGILLHGNGRTHTHGMSIG
jgi:hypothetical protein